MRSCFRTSRSKLSQCRWDCSYRIWIEESINIFKARWISYEIKCWEIHYSI